MIRGRKTKIAHEVLANGCWRWQGNIAPTGYGRLKIHYQEILAHRYYYEKYKGSISNKLTVDHLCKNRWCVNPDHMELVTRGENSKRGYTESRKRSSDGRWIH